MLSLSVLLSLAGCLSCRIRTDNHATPQVLSYQYRKWDGRLPYPHEYYSVEKDSTGAVRLAYSRGTNEIVMYKVPDDVPEKIGILVKNHRLRSLREYYRNRLRVLDGSSWRVEIRMKDSKEISSGGYMAHPSRKQREGLDAINAYLTAIVEGAADDNVIGHGLHWENDK